MPSRQSQSGNTIIEVVAVLLVVVLVGCAVTQNGVKPAAEENKARLDAQLLSRFVENFNLTLQIGKNAKYLAMLEGDGSARGLFVELHDLKLIPLEDMRKLAGASGKVAAPDAYDKENAELLTSENIIFTTASMGEDLAKMMRGKADEYGVVFCYNERWMRAKGATGSPIVMAGQTTARVLTTEALKLEFVENERSAELSALDLSKPDTVFGKFPFELISPE